MSREMTSVAGNTLAIIGVLADSDDEWNTRS
jgi:hypothetical protein